MSLLIYTRDIYSHSPVGQNCHVHLSSLTEIHTKDINTRESTTHAIILSSYLLTKSCCSHTCGLE